MTERVTPHIGMPQWVQALNSTHAHPYPFQVQALQRQLADSEEQLGRATRDIAEKDAKVGNSGGPTWRRE